MDDCADDRLKPVTISKSGRRPFGRPPTGCVFPWCG